MTCNTVLILCTCICSVTLVGVWVKADDLIKRSTKLSELFSLNGRDAIHTFIMFAIGAFSTFLLDAIEQACDMGIYSLSAINWDQIKFALFIVCVTYIQKCLGTNTHREFMKSDPDQLPHIDNGTNGSEKNPK